MIALTLLATFLAAAEQKAPPALAPPALPALPSAAIPGAPPEAWPLLEQTLATAADVPIKPGDQAAWIEQTREWLRGHPDSPLPQALAKAFAQVRGLSASAQAAVEASVAQPPALVSLPGQEIKRLVKRGSEVYAFGHSGVYRRVGERWAPMHPLDFWAVQVHDGVPYATGAEAFYEIRDVEAVPIHRRKGWESLFSRAGKLYMSTDAGLRVESDGGWRMVEGTEKMSKIDAVAEHEDVLYISHSHYAEVPNRGGEWKFALDAVTKGIVENVFRSSGLIDVFTHAGHLYAEKGKGLLYQYTPAEWLRIHEEGGRFFERVAVGPDLYLQAEHGVYRFGADGSRKLISEDFPRLRAGAEHGGRRYLATNSGLTEIEGDRFRMILPRSKEMEINDVVGVGRELLLATRTGIERLILDAAGMPWDWQPSVLESVAQGIASAAATEAPERPLLRDQGGRSLLGLGRAERP